MEQNRELRNKSIHIYGQLITTKRPRIHNGERTVLSVKGAGNTGQLTCKRMKLDHYLTPETKINFKTD